jgi:response regulator RpfG family c-di-GMP phosphodiesterase
MTLLRSHAATGDAIRLLSAIGDALGGHEAGFAMRVAQTAARFALHRGANAEMIAASYYAAALHGLGAVRVVVPDNVSEREAEIASWDAPVAGAAISATIAGLPRATGDYIRWHREAFDGTGFPDKLRWNGIPHAAMAINISRAFIEAIDAQGEDASPPEALFAIVGECGRNFAINVVREFREFYAANAPNFDEPFEPEWSLDKVDGDAVIAAMCSEIDAREERTTGRGDRLDTLVRSIAGASQELTIDTGRAAFAARLTSLGRVRGDRRADDFDPLARLGREARAASAASAAQILSSAPAYEPYAAIVAQTEEWFDGKGLPARRKGEAIDATARVLSVALAADALHGSMYANAANGYPEAPARIAAAAGTQFDPAVVAAYLKASA